MHAQPNIIWTEVNKIEISEVAMKEMLTCNEINKKYIEIKTWVQKCKMVVELDERIKRKYHQLTPK